MREQDDFEHRLGQGLRRWAAAGQPTLDLASMVQERARLGLPTDPGEGSGLGEAGVPVRGLRRRVGWLATAATLAALTFGLGATFPSWAGAAASWPLVGPYITQMLLEDAGLKWAYEMGLIQGKLAEMSQGGVTVRILGVVADARRTTVLYQVLGAPPLERADGRPIRSDSMISPPHERPKMPVEVYVATVNGEGGMSFNSPPEETPVGYVGTVSTLPLETEQAELELLFLVGENRIAMKVPASRVETDQFSQEVPVNLSQEIDGIRMTVEAVIYTPAETVVRYQQASAPFYGSWSRDPEEGYDYLSIGGQEYRITSGPVGVNSTFYQAFPPIEAPAQLVLRDRVKGVPIEAIWPLKEGAVAEVMGLPVTLTSYELTADGIGLAWESPEDQAFLGVGRFEVIDSEGRAYPLGGQSWSSSSNHASDGRRFQRYGAELPEGVTPVAVRATQAGKIVKGPWVFDLPRP